jgi:hypothetical protein
MSLADLWHYFGGDLAVTSGGDFEPVTGTLRGQQRVLRRLLTNPGGYLFEPTYGAGLPSFVGQPLDPAKITAVIRSQLSLEDAVATLPAPVITVTATPADPSAFAVSIAYNDADSNTPVILSFNVSS